MEITLVEFTLEEQQQRSDEIKSTTGYKPTEAKLYQSLKDSIELLFPDLEIKRIARAKVTHTLIFILEPLI